MSRRCAAGQPAVAPKPLNSVIASCPPSGIRKFFDVAQQMENVISLGVGEPDFVTPWRIREAAIWSLERGYTTYTSNSGIPALRNAICGHLEKRYCVSYHPERECLVTVGVSEALDLAMRVLLNPGDEVLIPEPCYVSYVPCVQFAGGRPIYVPTRASDGFRLHASEIVSRITPRTKAILLGNPANPTGAVQGAQELKNLAQVAEQHGIYVVADEVYDRLTYAGEHQCMGAVPGARERTIVLGGFSKAYAMTGWRVGYACGPEPVTSLMARVHQYTMLCASHTAQLGALEALNGAETEVNEMVREYDRRRRYFVQGLNRIGLKCAEPGGAFYAFPSIAQFGLTSEAFAEQMLMEERVAVVPGSAFGPNGEGHVRCSYATSLANLDAALLRMGSFVERLGRTTAGNGRSATDRRRSARRAVSATGAENG